MPRFDYQRGTIAVLKDLRGKEMREMLAFIKGSVKECIKADWKQHKFRKASIKIANYAIFELV